MLNDEPLVSIVTVTYNAEMPVRKTLESIAAQTCRDFEHIVVDGASTDCTLDVVRQLGVAGVRIVSEPDKGLYDAMNKGVELASGEWIIFMNAGDYFCDAQSLQKACDSLAADDVDILYSDVVYDYGEFSRRIGAPLPEEAARRIRKDMCFFHNAMLIRASFHRQYRYDLHYRIAADYDLLLRMVLGGARLRYHGEPIACIETGAGLSYVNRMASLRERHCIIQANAPAWASILYNTGLMLDTMLRVGIKKLMPASLVRLIIRCKPG